MREINPAYSIYAHVQKHYLIGVVQEESAKCVSPQQGTSSLIEVTFITLLRNMQIQYIFNSTRLTYLIPK